jgi:hypothetical protein
MPVLNSDVVFWLFFLCINMVIFLPPYIIHYPLSSFFPKLSRTSQKSGQIIHGFFSRENQDIFRISADLAVISLIGHLFKIPSLIPILSIVFGSYIVLIVLFQITNAIFIKIYHKAFTGIELVQYIGIGYKIIKHSALYQVLILCCIIFLLFGMGILITFKYFNWIFQHDLSSISLSALCLAATIPFFVRKKIVTMAFTNKVFPLHFPEIYKLLFKTNYTAYKKSLNIDFDKVLAGQPATNFTLHTKPNVFLIVIESYGRIVLDEINNAGNNYKNRIPIEEDLLNKAGFNSVSGLAKSPVAGAGSWIAYSSFLFGINMENQMLFDSYFSSEQMHGYNHIFRFLKKNGYKNYRVNAVGKGFDGIAVPWDAYTKFYGVDEWIHFKDMNYKGQMYGFGPAPPDQYILHKSLENIKEQNVHPFSFFLLTQNSHSPFYSLPKYEDDWRDCDMVPEKVDEKGAKFISIPRLDNYFKAIDYELQSVLRFIKNQDGNNIFIIFGDHQPPVFDEAKKGNETPVHIIAKDQAFLDEWKKQGFTDGLMPDTKGTIFNFEGMLSLFTRAFISSYSNEKKLPDYKPFGNKLNNE